MEDDPKTESETPPPDDNADDPNVEVRSGKPRNLETKPKDERGDFGHK